MVGGGTYETSVMNRLAWRAKWRKRFQKYKTLITIIVIFLIAVPTILVFTPWGPKKVETYIIEQNPTDQPVKEWGTRWMYYMGRFYEITMRDHEAVQIYKKVIDEWYSEHYEAMEIPEGEKYVGYCVYYLARQRRPTNKHLAQELFTWYLDEFAPQPDSDPGLNKQAEVAKLVLEGKR